MTYKLDVKVTIIIITNKNLISEVQYNKKYLEYNKKYLVVKASRDTQLSLSVFIAIHPFLAVSIMSSSHLVLGLPLFLVPESPCHDVSRVVHLSLFMSCSSPFKSYSIAESVRNSCYFSYL